MGVEWLSGVLITGVGVINIAQFLAVWPPRSKRRMSGARPKLNSFETHTAPQNGQRGLGDHGRAVLGKTNTFSAANNAFKSYWAW